MRITHLSDVLVHPHIKRASPEPYDVYCNILLIVCFEWRTANSELCKHYFALSPFKFKQFLMLPAANHADQSMIDASQYTTSGLWRGDCLLGCLQFVFFP